MRRDHCNAVENRIRKGRLPRASGARREDVLFRSDSGADDIGVRQAGQLIGEVLASAKSIQWIGLARQNARLAVLIEGEDSASAPRKTNPLAIG